MSPIVFNLYTEYLTNEAFEWFTDFIIEGPVISIVKYVVALLLLAKEETFLQGMIEKRTETRRCCGIEMNVKKIKVMRISRQPPTVQSMRDQSV